MIDKIFKYKLMEGDLHLTNLLNRKLVLRKIDNKHLGEKDTDLDNRLFNFEKSIKNLVDIHDKIDIIIDKYKLKTETEYNDKKELLAF